ncbi:phosphate acetyltransferase [Candidatus Woesearchaeota archaeon]|nr:MAG: phosphate acetyltransferase [Candidatus Woesearchaeota archaeon]
MRLIAKVHAAAKKAEARIVLAEAEDERVLKAAEYLEQHALAHPILIGNKERLERMIDCAGFAITSDIHDFSTLDAAGQHAFAAEMARRRHGKLTEQEALALLKKDTKYFAAMLVAMHQADGYVAGNQCPTADTVRPALQLLDQGHRFASSYFILRFEGKRYFFADVALNPDPTPAQLATIGIDTAHSAQRFGFEPRVAFLSFSTKGSARHPLVEKVQQAVAIAKRRAPELILDGELQFDAAFVPSIARYKAPGSPVRGAANVFIFPDLNSGNIAYKIAQRMAGADAIGPIMQGLDAPVNDLSRGCSWEDIVNVVAITAIQAGNLEVER